MQYLTKQEVTAQAQQVNCYGYTMGFIDGACTVLLNPTDGSVLTIKGGELVGGTQWVDCPTPPVSSEETYNIMYDFINWWQAEWEPQFTTEWQD